MLASAGEVAEQVEQVVEDAEGLAQVWRGLGQVGRGRPEIADQGSSCADERPDLVPEDRRGGLGQCDRGRVRRRDRTHGRNQVVRCGRQDIREPLHLLKRCGGLLECPRQVGHSFAHALIGVGEGVEDLGARVDQRNDLAALGGHRPVQHLQGVDELTQVLAALCHHAVQPGQGLVGGQEALEHLGEL